MKTELDFTGFDTSNVTRFEDFARESGNAEALEKLDALGALIEGWRVLGDVL